MPEIQYKFSNTLREIPGQKQLHYGFYNDPKDHENLTHGQKSANSDHTKDCIYGTNLNGVKYYMNEMKEKQYQRTQKEPLGKSMQRNYNFPEVVKSEEFKFGVPTQGMSNLKDILYSCPNLDESQETKRMYKTTHGFSDPGEQKDRNYKWNMDKTQHSFGKQIEMEYDGAKKSLMTDRLESDFPKTKIVTKRLEDFRQATEEGLGKTKYKGTLNPNLEEDFAFGVSTIKSSDNNWNLAKCIHGDSNRNIQADPDLGRSVQNKSRLSARQPREHDPNKTFGVPSIRRDLPSKKNVSVCDINNYGNEKDAFELLYPNPHRFKGVDNNDFSQLITKEENNHKFSDEEFLLICQIVLANHPNQEGMISYKSFVDVMRSLKKDFVKFRGILK